jgi:hypothetical protein
MPDHADDRSDEDDRSEEDVGKDENVATSREGGRFVGRAASDDSFDAEQSGAEARSQNKGH